MNVDFNKSTATSGSGESVSPILVSNFAKKRRSKFSSKYKSPENGGFCKKKVKTFERENINFISAPGCRSYTTNDKGVRRNLNEFFSNLKEQKFAMKKEPESFSENLPKNENTYPQLHEIFNSVWEINSSQNYEYTEETCEKIQKLSNFENENYKSGLPDVTGAPVFDKEKHIHNFIDNTKTDSFEESNSNRERSPIMEFESPVRCSEKSNSDNQKSPILFNEFDSDAVYSYENDVAEVCTPVTNECIQNAHTTTTTPTNKIEEYNTQKLIEQYKFQKHSSPIFIDFETSPVTSKQNSFKISPLRSENLKNEGQNLNITSSKRTVNVSDLFCTNKTDVNEEMPNTCLKTISCLQKLQQKSVIIEECSSPPLKKPGFCKPNLLHSNLPNDMNKVTPSVTCISTTESYEKIEDCSQESYIGSCTLLQCRNKTNYNKGYDIVEYEQTQSECGTSSCDAASISAISSQELDTNVQVHGFAKDAHGPQCIKPFEKSSPGTTLLDSPSSKRRRKAKLGSLVVRLNQLVHRHRSETNVWKHENKYMGITKKSKQNLNVLRIINVWKECTRIVLHCCRDAIYNCRETETSREEANVDFKIIIVLETPDAQNLVVGSCVRIHPPWQILELENKRTLVFLCVSKVELLTNSNLSSIQNNVKRVTEKTVVRNFTCNILQNCVPKSECSCFCEVKGQYLPIIFGQNPVSETAAVQRYYSSRVHTIRSSVINSVIFSEIYIRGQVLYEFRCRNASDRERTTTNILLTDSENEVCQIVLKTESDEHKWQLEKTKHNNIRSVCFLFSGLGVCTQLEICRTPGLASLLVYLKQTSVRQDYLYVLSASCDWWNIKQCGHSVGTLLPDKIDNSALLQLCNQTEEIRQRAVVTVLLFTGKKLYFQGNRLKPYGVICVDDCAVVPKIKCGYVIEIWSLKCVSGMFRVDRYSTVTVQEECTKHISFCMTSLPCLTLLSETEELVTLKGIIKEINEEYCNCDKMWKDSVTEKCHTLCRKRSEESTTLISFINVSELPRECIVKVKGLNRTFRSESAVSLVCLVTNVLRNELGKVCGFIVENL